MLLLNVTTGKGESKSSQNFTSSGDFSFEFNDKNKVKAKAIVRRKAKSKINEVPTNSDTTKVEETPKEPLKLLDLVPEPKKSKKKSESTFNLDEYLSKNANPGVPKELPTVDFPDEPSKKGSTDKKSKKPIPEKKKKFSEQFFEQQTEEGPAPVPVPETHSNVVEFPDEKPEPYKKPKKKFSKISNPFPNQKQGNFTEKPGKSSESGTSDRKEDRKQVPNSENANVFSPDSVDTLKIHPHSVKNLKEVLNFTKLTHVQHRSIPTALEGKDLLIKSPTGSGKTLSYALPIVERLQNLQPKINRSMGIHALVVVPTRELVLQTYEIFTQLLKPFQWLVPGYLSGGEKRKAEKSRLRKGITILITTPGRICDHLLHTEAMKLDKVHILVLDEADRLLELGYENDVKKIVETIDDHNKDFRKIQKILLSATLSAGVKRLAGLALSNPVCVENESVVENTIDDMENDDAMVIPKDISQKYFIIPPKLRLITLIALMQQQWRKGARKILVFFPTQQVVDFHYDVMVDMLTQRFHKKPKSVASYLRDDDDLEASDDEEIDESEIFFPGLQLFKLFGSMTQVERMGVFKKFRNSKAGVLLCTDVAARGIDVPALDYVIQYSAPQELNMYIHRIGRTARAGNTGEAVIFLTENEEGFIEVLKEKNIEISSEDYNKSLKQLELPKTEVRFLDEKIILLQRRLEELLDEDPNVRQKAVQAFTSWICYYQTFSKELKHIFKLRELHMGHVANNLGLRESPTEISRESQRYSNRNKEETQKPKNRNFDFQHREHVPRGPAGKFNKLKRKYGDFSKTNFGKTSNISEFDSGLPEKKSKRK